MANQIIANLITSNISQNSSTDRITDSEVRSVLNAINSFIQDDISYNTAIPFDKMVSKMAAHTVTGAINFTANSTNAVPGCGTILRLTANGTNAPTFTGFKKTSASKDFINTAGVTNVLVFIFDGVDYWYSIFQDIAAVATDTIAPTVVSKNTTSSINVRIVFSEPVTATLAGWSFKKNGSALAASAISGSGTTWDFTVAAMAAGDTLLVSYDSATGNTLDGSGNELASITDSAITNNLVGGTFTNTSRWAFYKNSSMVRSGGTVTQWTNVDGDTTRDFVQLVGNPYPVDATTDGMQMTAATENLKYASPQTITGAVTMYALIKRTGTGALLGGQNTNGYGIYTDATTMFFSPGTNAEGFQQNSTGIANMTAFHVLTLVWTPGSVAKVYLDGVQVGTFTGTISAAGWKIYYVGGFNSDKFLGYINGLALFNTAHDAATVSAQYSLFQTAAQS
jgi:hypothetical protein